MVCNLGNLSEQTDATVTIKVKPTNSAAIAGTITNSAQADAGVIVKSTEVNTTVTPGLSIVKEASPGTIEVGDDLKYTLTVKNRGGSNAANVIVIDELPGDVDFVESDAEQGSCDEQPDSFVECDLGTIAAGSTVRVELLVRPTKHGELTNTAQVFANDSEEAIDEDSESTTVEKSGGNNNDK